MLCSIVIPTRDRAEALASTLAAIDARCGAALRLHGGEVIVADNASAEPARVPRLLPESGVPVRLLRIGENMGAGARNLAAEAAAGEWLLMLDDDSAPRDGAFAELASRAPAETAAIGGEIFVTDGHGRVLHREFGGLPEVFVGCGALVRRAAFLAAGGYDAGFGFYAEEPDLCARLIGGGWRVAFSRGLRVDHAKSPAGRDRSLVVRRLTRNTALVAHRYTPDDRRNEAVEAVIARCRRIAEQQGVPEAAREGELEFRERAAAERPTPLSAEAFERFEGWAAVRRRLGAVHAVRPIERARVLMPGGVIGKGSEVIEAVVRSLGAEVVGGEEGGKERGAVLIPGTLSPGPMLDAAERLRAEHPGACVVLPWSAGEPLPDGEPGDGGAFLERSCTAAR